MAVVTDIESLNWQKMVAPYSQPSVRKSVWQLLNTLVPFALMWAALLYSVQISYWLTLLLAIPTAGLQMRTFVLFHDCCHRSFFRSRRANEVAGVLLGFLTFTPFYQWGHDHAIHHATAGDLDRRWVGDVPTMTVDEFRAASWTKRTGYRILRSPWILFTVGPTIMFVIVQRFWPSHAGRRERWSVVYTNLALLATFAVMSLLFGAGRYVAALLPVTMLATALGVWGFYVQHQFEGVYWARREQWNFVRAGLQGSSYYDLPAVLCWFTASIGFHHIHHLSPRIPNYLLAKCHRDNPALQIKPMTILASLKSARLRLVDDRTFQLVGYDALRR